MAVSGGVLFLLCAAIPAAAQVSVLTYQYDRSRGGANLSEAVLTPANVTPSKFGKLFADPVDGYIYAQPLYVPNVSIPAKGVHNVVYAATEHDSVYAFDADAAGAPLWHTSFLGADVTTVPASDTGCGQITPEIGITGTPVIDPASGTMYLVAMTKETSGGATHYVQRLHALDISTGSERNGSPVVIQATFPGTGEGGSTLTFNPKNYKQRPGLALWNGVVYTSWSSHCDIGAYHGWVIGYDAQTLAQTTVYNSTPNGNEGSFWAGGAAPAIDANGYLYVVSGNGTFDKSSGGPDLGESYIKLGTSGGLTVADYFTPFNYVSLNNGDVDTGSAGVALLDQAAGSAAHPHLMVGAGKEGRVYLLDRDRMGGLQTAQNQQLVQELPGAIGGLFGNPSYFNQTIYLCGSGDNLKAFPISQAHLATSPSSKSSAQFGFPGCVPGISANGSDNGIVWILESSGSLHAYDARNLATELYNSSQNQARDSLGGYVKFSVPTIANAAVYAGTQTALVAYGLLAKPSGWGASNAASGDPNAIAPGSIMSLYGQGLAQTTAQASSYPLPISLGGATVTVNGTPAPLFYASSGQINLQVPWGLAAGAATVAVQVGGVSAGTLSVNVQASGPGLFLIGQGRAAALNLDLSVHSTANPAAAGSAISLFATGLGAVSPAVPAGSAVPSGTISNVISTVTASVGGESAQVIFAGLAPGYAGLYQVNVILPALPPGEYASQITVDGISSNPGWVSIR
jgi:uncharacterized protein (TIGR03437 family)